MLPLIAVTLSGSPVLASGRRGPRRAVPRALAIVGAVAVAILVVWALVMLALWVYAWFRLGGIDLRALDEDADRLGVEGALAPADAITALVILTEPRDPTRIQPPDLAGPVMLVQAGGPRQHPAVLLLPQVLSASADGHPPRTLDAIHADGGTDALAQAIIDYTQVRVDHVVSISIEALPSLVEIVGDVEICMVDGCRTADADQVRAGLRATRDEDWARVVAATVRGVATGLGAQSIAWAPLAAKRAVDIVAEQVDTDVSMRGRRILELVELLATPTPLQIDRVPLLLHPVTGDVVPLDEPALARFQHLQYGTAFDTRDADDELLSLVLADLRIGVLNGAGIAGLAAQVEADLAAEGLQVVGTGNAPLFDHAATTVAYAAGDPRISVAAEMIGEMLGGVAVIEHQGPLRFEGELVDVLITAGADRRPPA